MEEHTLTVTVDRLFVPLWVGLEAHKHIQALVREECDGGDGEFDAPADIVLKRMFDRNTIKEWEAVCVTSEHSFTVFEELRIVFKVVA